MALRARLVEALKTSLRSRGLTYRSLAKKIGVSEPTVKRMFSNGTFTLERIEQILEVIELDLEELARLVRDGSAAPTELSHDQEATLAQDARLFSVFWLIQNEWNFAETLASFAIPAASRLAPYRALGPWRRIAWGRPSVAGSLGRGGFCVRGGGPF